MRGRDAQLENLSLPQNRKDDEAGGAGTRKSEIRGQAEECGHFHWE